MVRVSCDAGSTRAVPVMGACRRASHAHRRLYLLTGSGGIVGRRRPMHRFAALGGNAPAMVTERLAILALVANAIGLPRLAQLAAGAATSRPASLVMHALLRY